MNLRLVFKKIHFKAIFFELFFLGLLVFSITYVAFFNVIFQPFVFILLGPLVLWMFYKLPEVKKSPDHLIRKLFFLWLPTTILWPYFVVVQLPGIDLHPSRVMLLLLIVLWVYFFFKSAHFRQRFTEHNEVYRFFSVFVLLLILSKLSGLFLSSYFSVSLNGFFKELTEAFIPAILALILIKDRLTLDKLLSILAWVGVVVIVIGLWEYRIQTTVFSAYLPGFLTGSKEHIVLSIEPKVRDGEYRLQSLFGHPLSYAQYLALVFPLFAYQYLNASLHRFKFFWAGMMVLLAFVMFGTGSRSVLPALFIEFGVLLLVLLVVYLKNNKASFLGWAYVVSSPIVLVGGLLAFIKGRSAFMGGSDLAYSSTQARYEMWDLGMQRVLEKPIQGVIGFGHSTATEVINWRGGISIDTYFLSVLIESGILGFTLFILMLLLVVYTTIRMWIKSRFEDYLPIVLLASILGYSVIAFISSLTHLLHIFYIVVALVFVLALIQNRSEVNEKS